MEIKPLFTRAAVSLLEEIPGATTIHSLLEEANRQYRARRADEFLKQVAVLLQHGQQDAARVLITGSITESWALDCVQRGYDAVIAATDPHARACIAALVAEYIHKRRAPDRTYRRVAGLLADVTGEEIICLRKVGAAIFEIASQISWPGGRATLATADNGSNVKVSGYASDRTKHRATLFAMDPSLFGVLQMLTRHGIARDYTGMGGDTEDYFERLIFDAGEPIDAMEILLSCIQVVSV